MTFQKTPVSCVLTGEEWFAICARLANKGLSDNGRQILNRAALKLGAQLVKAANTLNGKVVEYDIPRSGN